MPQVWQTADGESKVVPTREVVRATFTVASTFTRNVEARYASMVVKNGVRAYALKRVMVSGESRYITDNGRLLGATVSFMLDVMLGTNDRTKPIHAGTFALALRSFPENVQLKILDAAIELNGDLHRWKNISERHLEYMQGIKRDGEFGVRYEARDADALQRCTDIMQNGCTGPTPESMPAKYTSLLKPRRRNRKASINGR